MLFLDTFGRFSGHRADGGHAPASSLSAAADGTFVRVPLPKLKNHCIVDSPVGLLHLQRLIPRRKPQQVHTSSLSSPLCRAPLPTPLMATPPLTVALLPSRSGEGQGCGAAAGRAARAAPVSFASNLAINIWHLHGNLADRNLHALQVGPEGIVHVFWMDGQF